MIRQATLLLLALGFTACGPRAHDRRGGEPEPDAGRPRLVTDGGRETRTPDAGPASGLGDAGGPATPDAGPPDAGPPTTYRDVRPILVAACGECHSEGAAFGSRFATDPEVLQQPTTGYNGGCLAYDGGQLSLQECVVATARHQWQHRGVEPECNSTHPGQYHRDYRWTCLEPGEVEALEAWARSGYPL